MKIAQLEGVGRAYVTANEKVEARIELDRISLYHR